MTEHSTLAHILFLARIHPAPEFFGGPRCEAGGDLFATFCEKIGDRLKKESFTTRGSIIFPPKVIKRPPMLEATIETTGVGITSTVCHAGLSSKNCLPCYSLVDVGRGEETNSS